jgi:hypothetical protein
MVFPWLVCYTKRSSNVRYRLTHHRTLQELALSRRVLCFTSDQAFFCCPQGIIAESFSAGDDRCGSLPIIRTQSMGTCGLLHLKDKIPVPCTIEDIVRRFNAVFLSLLRAYYRRHLTFESDRLYAFLGVINAEARILGPFHWGLPTALFVRALSLERFSNPNVNPRPNYPSWSWTSWTFPDGGWILQVRGCLRPLVHMYICNEQSGLQLLYGPLDDRTGVEGYCPETINSYNICIDTEPLPVLPSIDRVPPLVWSAENLSHILIFWSHVARIDVMFLGLDAAVEKWYHEHNGGTCDVALLATSSQETSTVELERSNCLAIVLQRDRGFARVIQPIQDLDFKVWRQGSPKLELLLLA